MSEPAVPDPPGPIQYQQSSAAGRPRPWWGPIDVLWGVLFVAVVSVILGGVAVLIATSIGGDDFNSATTPVYALFFATLVQQGAQAVWPWIVSRRKGLGMAKDWGLRFTLPRDLGYGIVIALACLVGAAIATQVAAAVVGLADTSDASNTAIISDNEGSPWLIAMIFVVVIGAPFTEELLFRGLFLQAFKKALGVPVAIIGSTLLFTLPHIVAGASLDEAVVLWSAIFVIGLILAWAAVQLDSLGPPIIGHCLFNGIGTLAALLA